MELKVLKDPDLVIALDIGSTYSGYAWQSKGEYKNNRNIHFNTNWGAGALQLHKTKTCILIQIKQEQSRSNPTAEQRKIMSERRLVPESIEKVTIGHAAERQYMAIAKNKEIHQLYGNYYLFSRFKLYLYHENFDDERIVEDQLDQPVLLVNVMALFIKALKDHCLNKIRTMGITINIQKTLFVVTVPAIWSHEAKTFMRNAAVEVYFTLMILVLLGFKSYAFTPVVFSIKAGIENNNLLLALEPEAAAISCMFIPEQMRESMNKFGDKGQRFLVADLGGGTADLSAVEVDNSGNLKELCEPSGRCVGGQNINDAFLQACNDSFEGEQWKKIFSKTTPIDMLQMEADFEQTKVTIGTDDSDAESIIIAIPEAVKDGLQKNTIRLKPGASGCYKNKELVYESAFVRKHFFETTCTEVYANTIERVLNKPEASGISTVVLVGGFAESPIVVCDIREKIAKDFPAVKVIVPYSPFKSVLEGAVIYGHDPLIFSSRISGKTFGIAVNCRFDDTQHDQSKKWKNEETGNFYCKDIFDIHVRKGQSVRLLEKQPTRIYNPMQKGQKAARLPIYGSDLDNPKYTTEKKCRRIGEINVKMPDTTGETSRVIEVTMIYGGAELSVSATDKTTGEKFKTKIMGSDLI